MFSQSPGIPEFILRPTTIQKHTLPSMASCILYEDDSSSVTILDIPRSLELAQGPSFKQKLISSAPLQDPYPSVEPKSEKAKANLRKPSIEELLLEKHVELVMEGMKEAYGGPWCLPRITEDDREEEELRPKKRRKLVDEEAATREEQKLKQEEIGPLYQNPSPSSLYLNSPGSRCHIPPHSIALLGSLHQTLPLFTHHAPKFNLILIDPPWPNRSARRKGSYELSYSSTDIKALLCSIPIEDHLEDEGFVGVWITNKPAFRSMLLEEGGLFDLWEVEYIEEWVWLKVTEKGEPICKLDSVWRKAYEILLVGRKKGSIDQPEDMENKEGEGVKRRVIIGIPDVHSRKPNLKGIFGKVIGREGFRGLEVFARNMTEGWWTWGNEVLKFQTDEHWVPMEQSS